MVITEVTYLRYAQVHVITLLPEKEAPQVDAKAARVIGANPSILTRSGTVVELANLVQSIPLLMPTGDVIALKDGMNLSDFREVTACQNVMLL
jgi:hypothetical protein